MLVYFDTNVFRDLKGSVGRTHNSADLLPAVQNEIDEEKFSLVLGTTVLEETLPALTNSPRALQEDLQMMFRLLDHRRMVKPAEILLREAVQSYGYDRRRPDMFTKAPPLLTKFLRSGKVTREFSLWAKEAAELHARFPRRMNPAFEKTRSIGEERRIGRPRSFSEFWDAHATARAEDLCEHYDVHKRCMERGLDGLLENRTVRLYVIYYLSFIYSKWFGEQREPGQVRDSESGDFFHAVQASSADVFVTGDKRLRSWLTRVPVEGWEVLSLNQFVERHC